MWCACTDTWALGKKLKNKGMRQKQTWKTRPGVIRAPGAQRMVHIAWTDSVCMTVVIWGWTGDIRGMCLTGDCHPLCVFP